MCDDDDDDNEQQISIIFLFDYYCTTLFPRFGENGEDEEDVIL